MADGNFPFPYAGDFYSSRAGFEEENRHFIQPFYHALSSQLSSVPSQVQYGYNTVVYFVPLETGLEWGLA